MTTPAECAAATVGGVIYDPTLRQACQALYYAALDPATRAYVLGLDVGASALAFLSGPALPTNDMFDGLRTPAGSLPFTPIGSAAPSVSFNVGLGIDPLALAQLSGQGAPAMGFLDDLIGSVKKTVGVLLEGAAAIPTIAPIIIGAAGAIQATQQALNGNVGPMPMPMPAATPQMMAAMMAASGGAATQGSAAQEAFAAACRTDPSCVRAIEDALRGGNMTGGMMNGSVDVSEASLAAAGFPPALVMALKTGGQGALNALRQLIPGLAVGAAGAAIGTALTVPSGMNGSAKFPRAIFIPDNKGGVREYKYRGRPVLYSGDIAAARRVVKVAKRARSSRGAARRQSKASQILMLPAGRTACGKCGNGSCGGC